jgi:hypothetical protein
MGDARIDSHPFNIWVNLVTIRTHHKIDTQFQQTIYIIYSLTKISKYTYKKYTFLKFGADHGATQSMNSSALVYDQSET